MKKEDLSTDSKAFLSRMQDLNKDPKLLEENKRTIKKKMSQCLVSNGFIKRKPTLFYRVQNDIVGFFAIEHPPMTTYTHFAIYPLFMPPLEYVFFNYGFRLEKALNDPEMALSNYATQDQIEAWCIKVNNYVNTHVLHLLEQTDTAEKIYGYFTLIEPWPSSLFPLMFRKFWYKLIMYTCLTLHRYSEANNFAKQGIEEVNNDQNKFFHRIQELKKNTHRPLSAMLEKNFVTRQAQLEKEIEAYRYVTELASSVDDQAVDDVIDSWRRKNISFFTGK